jgi:ketosteroid isomerase-like protein
MRKIITIAVVCAALSIASSAQHSDLKADVNPAAESEIKALEMKLPELIVRADWEEYAKHLTSDYLHIRENGQTEDKEETMATLRDIKRKIIVMEMEPASLAIRLYGDTAIASAEFTVRVRDSGQVKSRRTRQTDVIVEREGQWYLVAEQATQVGK